jgi:hypothetical protein
MQRLWSTEEIGERGTLEAEDLAWLSGLPDAGKLWLSVQRMYWRRNGRFADEEWQPRTGAGERGDRDADAENLGSDRGAHRRAQRQGDSGVMRESVPNRTLRVRPGIAPRILGHGGIYGRHFWTDFSLILPRSAACLRDAPVCFCF